MGDFNSPPAGNDSGAYRIVTGQLPPVQVDKKFSETYAPEGSHLPDFKFLDTRVETPRFNVSANFATFSGWSPTVTKWWTAIDFVLGGSNRNWYVPSSYRHTWEGDQASLVCFPMFICVSTGYLPHSKSVQE